MGPQASQAPLGAGKSPQPTSSKWLRRPLPRWRRPDPKPSGVKTALAAQKRPPPGREASHTPPPDSQKHPGLRLILYISPGTAPSCGPYLLFPPLPASEPIALCLSHRLCFLLYYWALSSVSLRNSNQREPVRSSALSQWGLSGK